MRFYFRTIWFLLILFPVSLKADIQILSSDEHGVSFVYRPGELVQNEDGNWGRIEFPDAEPIASLGSYDLPAKVVRIGLPQRGGVRVEFNAKTGGVKENFTLRRVPYVLFEADSVWRAGEEDSPAVYPDSVVEIGQIEVLRDVRFITLKIYPAQYQPVKRKLVWFDEIKVVVKFQAVPEVNSLPDPLDGLIGGMLLNGEEALNWKLKSSRLTNNPYQRARQWLKIKVGTTGIYRITGAELARAGVPINGLDPQALALWTVGEHEPNGPYPDSLQPVAIFVTGDDDGRFDLHDTILFYGLAPDHWVNKCSVWVKNLYIRDNVYWLTWSGSGKRMRRGFGPDTTGTPILQSGGVMLHQELDLECPARAGLMWVWAKIFKAADVSVARFTCALGLNYPIQIEEISGRLYSASAGNEITIRLNGRAIGNFQFGSSSYPSPYDFSIDSIGPVPFRDNQLAIELRGSGEKKVYLDYLEVKYFCRLSLFAGPCNFFVDTVGDCRFLIQDASTVPVVFDVTDPYVPAVCLGLEKRGDSVVFSRRLLGWTEFVVATPEQFLKPKAMELKTPGFLWSETFLADYWIVTPSELMQSAQELARFRSNRIAGIPNARVRVVNLQEIYDDFGFGLEEPGAIKRFFRIKRPVYALLVGDGTYDYKNNLNRVQPPGVPAYEFGFGLVPDAGDRSALAQDVWYADLEGEGGSPDIILGRVCARSEGEFRQFVDKLVQYEIRSNGYWTRRFLLMADDEYQRYPDRPDELRFRHIEQCEGIAALAENRLDPVKVYLTEFPFLGPKSKPQANNELIRQLNIGALIWVFFGHGSPYSLTHEEVFTVTRVSDIDNQNRVPFCFLGSCSVGRFDDTRSECIAEELVRMNGGTVATVAASTATPSGNNLVFARNLLTPLFFPPESIRTIGYCFFKAWVTDRSYHLFGDPATVLKLPTMSTQNLHISPETLHPGKVFRARTIVELTDADAEWRLFGPLRHRYYESPVGVVNYFLSGPELARGTFRVKDGRFYCEGIFPAGIPLDTVFAGNGYYAPLANSCRYSAQVRSESVNLGLVKYNIPFYDSISNRGDYNGPEIDFSYRGRQLQDSAAVPANLQLDIIAQDQSGILIAPVPGMAPHFYLNRTQSAVDISDRFEFDDSSYTTARAHIELSLSKATETLFVVVADNFLNRTIAKLILKPLFATTLRIDSVAVYPNPVKNGAVFGFVASQPGTVQIRIYTLNGRLVRNLGDFAVSFGYNQIAWDGRDENGYLLPNGVYLFSLRAKSFYLDGKGESVTVRDKFLIVR
ncbi:T9SS type A sorting domain-containing protein [candidate division WOR-3 bacterium]|nr:T9SS type A sorting domain-containing protein [candidate division WOR-3 bacterium]